MSRFGPHAMYDAMSRSAKIRAVGMQIADGIRMMAIAGAESSWQTDATPPDFPYVRGLMQINSRAWPQFDANQLWDPVYSIDAAAEIWHDSGNMWCAWDTYKSKRYIDYISQVLQELGPGLYPTGIYPPHFDCNGAPPSNIQPTPTGVGGFSQGDPYGLNAWKAAEQTWLESQGAAAAEGFVRWETTDLMDAAHIDLRGNLAELLDRTNWFRRL